MGFYRGQQIVYIPSHANGNIKHPDCEFGFVTGVNSVGDPYCRYWSKSSPGELRTKANSECTPKQLVRLHDSRDPHTISSLLETM